MRGGAALLLLLSAASAAQEVAELRMGDCVLSAVPGTGTLISNCSLEAPSITDNLAVGASTCCDEIEQLRREVHELRALVHSPPPPPFRATDAMIFLPFDSSSTALANEGRGGGTLSTSVGSFTPEGHHGGGFHNIAGYVSGCSACGPLGVLTSYTGPFTAALWVRTSTGDQHNYVFDFRSDSFPSAGYWHLTNGNEHHFGGFSSTSAEKIVNYPRMDGTQWVHWAVTSDPDGDTGAFYENGVKVTDLLGALKFGGFFIGSRYTGSHTWNGLVDSVTLFHEALSVSEIVSLVNSPL